MKRSATACALLLALTACGDPLGGIERVSDGATLPPEPGTAALPSEEELAREGSILGELLTGPAQTANDPGATDSDIAPDTGNSSDLAKSSNSSDADEAVPERMGVLGWLRQAAQSEASTGTKPTVAPAAVPAAEFDVVPDKTKTKAAQSEASRDLVDPQKRRGLFGAASTSARNGPDNTDVAVGTVLPFGIIARNCDAKPAQTAKVVDKAARKGRGYTLFDTAPDATTPRTFYITGFSDNCPRQFTASLALFGDPAFHEQLRYGLPAEEYPYSSTDQAYEKLKRKVCNVGRNKPCGDRINRLSRNTTFVSAYENFTDNAKWADMLLHDGAVLASALKTP
ncbi:hypothetical protein [uncultured Tateyamaria sp.]|uniref:hypothetical protein n=1 Tax=uncultured Tateyamaria sp. TaxID=455651 RepID=UPI0026021C8E|nr:hypothetical protein [uncultured Tateyamaria sp.]